MRRKKAGKLVLDKGSVKKVGGGRLGEAAGGLQQNPVRDTRYDGCEGNSAQCPSYKCTMLSECCPAL